MPPPAMMKSPKKIAICLFGLNRSLSITHHSIKQNLIAPFLDQGTVKLYGAFLEPGVPVSNPRSDEVDIHPEKNYHLLNFENITTINQESFDKLHCPLRTASRTADCYNDNYQSAQNIIRALYSISASYELSLSGGKHDFYIFARPDLFYIDKFNAAKHISTLESNQSAILTPKWQQWDGLNDRIAIMPGTVAKLFSSRFDEVDNFITHTQEPLHAESMLLWHAIKNNLDYSKNIQERGIRVRSNGAFNAEFFSQTGISTTKQEKYRFLKIATQEKPHDTKNHT